MNAKKKMTTSKVLSGIAVAASGLALAISIATNAEATQMPGDFGQQHSFNKRSQALQLNANLLKRASDRFPLMLPQPTKIERQNKYAVG
jgi:hypothetical protein